MSGTTTKSQDLAKDPALTAKDNVTVDAEKDAALTPAEALTAFLVRYSISDEKALAAFRQSQVLSLKDLLATLSDEEERKTLAKALVASGSKFAPARFGQITIESVRNELYVLDNPAARQTSEPLLEFLTTQNVLAKPGDRDKLLGILFDHNVASLGALHKLKSTGPRQLDSLTASIAKWDAAAGIAFRKITAASVARATSGPQKIDDDLQTFLKHKAKLPSGSEKVLAEFGVTSLDQLKKVREDSAQSQELATKLEDSGILNAKEAFNKITVEDINEEISTLDSPATRQAKQKETALREAIEEVKRLRAEVQSAAKDNLDATVARVTEEYDAVLGRVRDACKLDFEKVDTAAQQSRTALTSLLDRTIENAEKASNVLAYVDKTQMPLTKLIRRLEMLCGALVTPAEIAMKRGVELVSMPDRPNDMAKMAEAQESIHIQYKGSDTKSFASSYASQTGSSVSAVVDTSAAGFVGSGLGAISAAASYSDAKKASRDQENFHSSATATCGEIRYIYAPKQTVQFRAKDIPLSDDARQELAAIAGAAANERPVRIRAFYERFGSHFFTRFSLGGRYEFSATGETISTTGKEKLVTAVANGSDWAVSSSASYLGLGGAVQTANAVVGSVTSAQAQADQMRFATDSASVRVSIKVLGGAGLAPRDVWSESLAFNSTWAVIGRAEPVAMWELLARVPQNPPLPQSVLALAPVFEEVWVRDIFREAVRDSNPILYSRIGRETAIKTCVQLNGLVRELQAAEPPVRVVVVQQTSALDGHPTAIAQATTTKGLKLIGGGARVDYGDGSGTMLTGSYPEGEGWVASAKEHLLYSPARVTAFAVYLVDPEDIWDVKRVEVKSERRTDKPKVTAELPPEYVLTGGGARVHEYGDHGVMLTACCPSAINGVYRAWTAQGKDHMKADEALVTAWAIGIRCRNMRPGVNPAPPQLIAQSGQGQPLATASAQAGNAAIVIGGGAAVTWRVYGAFLTATYPDSRGNQWSASAKDHIKPDPLNLTTWCIARTGEAITMDAALSAASGR